MATRWRQRTRPITETPSQTLLNRELSWLDLNTRVLELAADPDEPLLERVKFCAIFSSNLDEFFMVRVAGLLDQVVARRQRPLARRAHAAAGARRGPRARARADRARSRSSGATSSCPALAAEGIVVGTVDDATEAELRELEATLRAPDLPGADPARGRARASRSRTSRGSRSRSASRVRDPRPGEERFARVKVPEALPRFVSIGDARPR